MAPIRYSTEISKPPEEVSAYMSDVSRHTEWQEGLVSSRADGPMKVGARITQTRRLGPRQQTITSEVTEHSPPRSFAFRGIDGPIRPRGKGTIEPIDDGARSRVTFELDFEGHGIGKLLLPLVRRQARRLVPQNYERLKQRLESGAA